MNTEQLQRALNYNTECLKAICKEHPKVYGKDSEYYKEVISLLKRLIELNK